MGIRSLREQQDRGLQLWFVRTAAAVFTLFGIGALALAGFGVYGVRAYLVSQQSRELSIRLALGASPSRLSWALLREGLAVAAVGLLAGLSIAVLFARGVAAAGLLTGVEALDPVAFGLAALVLTFTAGAASYLPAWRMTRATMRAGLRYE
jgi:ABC-type antimicrobial peptide transport system permease subunit